MDAGASDMQPATDDDGNVVGFKVGGWLGCGTVLCFGTNEVGGSQLHAAGFMRGLAPALLPNQVLAHSPAHNPPTGADGG